MVRDTGIEPVTPTVDDYSPYSVRAIDITTYPENTEGPWKWHSANSQTTKLYTTGVGGRSFWKVWNAFGIKVLGDPIGGTRCGVA